MIDSKNILSQKQFLLGKIICEEVIEVELNVKCVKFKVIENLRNIYKESSRKNLIKFRRMKKEFLSEKKMDGMVQRNILKVKMLLLKLLYFVDDERYKGEEKDFVIYILIVWKYIKEEIDFFVYFVGIVVDI